MTRFVVRPGKSLRGTLAVPGDKSIAHRALIFAALARGVSTLRGMPDGEDVLSTARCLADMGVRIEQSEGVVRVHGVGLHGLRLPKKNLDCGNSGTTMRLLAGVLAGQRFGCRLIGDASLTRRPMGRIVDPLRARGAYIAGSSADGRAARDGEKCFAPLSIAPLVDGETLRGGEFEMPIASAQVKSALLLSGLYADGPTIVHEPMASRDHTERMLLALGAPVQLMGTVAMLEAGCTGWDAFDWTIPGDLSSAAFLLAAALLVPGSEVEVQGVLVNPTRTGILDALRLLGITVDRETKDDAAGGEPTADLRITSNRLRGGLIAGEVVLRMIDEVPVFAALATQARGPIEIGDAAELRVKESDRLHAMAEVLGAFGAKCAETPDGLCIEPGAKLRGAVVSSGGDHRIAMSAALLGLIAEGVTEVHDVDCVDTSYPGFAQALRSLGAEIEVV